MGFLSLFLVASMPIVQVLLIGLLGAFLASGYSNILSVSARKDMNKVVFAVFTPSLMFASLARTVTLQDIISWWFMPVNIGIIFLVGGLLGWAAVKILRPPRHLRGLIIASCSAGNFGNLMLIIVPAVCEEDGNPFGGDRSICSAHGLSYASFSMALGGFYIWTHTYSLMSRAGKLYRRNLLRNNLVQEIEHKDSLANGDLAKVENGEAAVDQEALTPTAAKPADDESQQNQLVSCSYY